MLDDLKGRFKEWRNELKLHQGATCWRVRTLRTWFLATLPIVNGTPKFGTTTSQKVNFVRRIHIQRLFLRRSNIFFPFLLRGAICHLLRHCGDEAERFDVCRLDGAFWTEVSGSWRLGAFHFCFRMFPGEFLRYIIMYHQCINSRVVPWKFELCWEARVQARAPNAERDANHVAVPADEHPVLLPADRPPTLHGGLHWRILRSALVRRTAHETLGSGFTIEHADFWIFLVPSFWAKTKRVNHEILRRQQMISNRRQVVLRHGAPPMLRAALQPWPGWGSGGKLPSKCTEFCHWRTTRFGVQSRPMGLISPFSTAGRNRWPRCS